MQFVIRIADQARTVPVRPDEVLLSALLSRGIRFAYSCQSGNCGACKCRLISGEVSLLVYSEEALSDAERERGIILACRTRVKSNVTIQQLSDCPDN